jgi:hypothetical protein
VGTTSAQRRQLAVDVTVRIVSSICSTASLAAFYTRAIRPLSLSSKRRIVGRFEPLDGLTRPSASSPVHACDNERRRP